MQVDSLLLRHPWKALKAEYGLKISRGRSWLLALTPLTSSMTLGKSLKLQVSSCLISKRGIINLPGKIQ